MANWQALGGVGEGIAGLTSGILAKREDDYNKGRQAVADADLQEDRARARSAYEDAQTRADAERAYKIGQLNNFASDSIDPIYQVDQSRKPGGYINTQPATAPQPQDAGLAPESLADKVGVSPAPDDQPTGSQAAPPPGSNWQPQNPELVSLNAKYQSLRRQAATGIAGLEAKYAGNPEALEKAKAAYYDANKPAYDALGSQVQAVHQKIMADNLRDTALDITSKLERGDRATIESVGGPGSYFGRDPVTGLQGILRPNDQNPKGLPNFIPIDLKVIGVLEQKGVYSGKEAADAREKVLTNVANLTKAWKEGTYSVQASYGKDVNKDIQVATKLGSLNQELSKLSNKPNQNEQDKAKMVNIKAQIRALDVKGSNAETTREKAETAKTKVQADVEAKQNQAAAKIRTENKKLVDDVVAKAYRNPTTGKVSIPDGAITSIASKAMKQDPTGATLDYLDTYLGDKGRATLDKWRKGNPPKGNDNKTVSVSADDVLAKLRGK
jgi:hypothetical protein